MANCNVDRLQSTHTCWAFGEVGVGVRKDLQRPVQADQRVCKVAVNNSGQVDPEPFVRFEGTLLLTSKRRPAIWLRPGSVP